MARARPRRILLLSAIAALLITACTTKPPPKVESFGPVDQVLVKKSTRQLQLISRGAVVREYRVALGGSPVGHKYREGDQRTPEGRYILNWRNPRSNYHKAIHISYPNERDRMVASQLGYRPGGMIMLHGMPNYIQSESMRKEYLSRDWTQGCIAVQNHEIDEIWRMVPDGTPIHIMP